MDKKPSRNVYLGAAFVVLIVVIIIAKDYAMVYDRAKEKAESEREMKRLERRVDNLEDGVERLKEKVDQIEESQKTSGVEMSLGEIQRLSNNGVPIEELLELADCETVWLNMGYFLEKGADIQAVHDKLPKDAVWLRVKELLAYGYDADKLADELAKDGGALRLRIDEFMEAGYDIDKLASKLDISAIWLEADKLTKYGADTEVLRNRILEDGDEFLCSLVESGNLYPKKQGEKGVNLPDGNHSKKKG